MTHPVNVQSMDTFSNRQVKGMLKKLYKVDFRRSQSMATSISNSNFDPTDFKVWRSLYACHSEGATYHNHCRLMVEKKMFFQ
jgi:hypothetical protein